jgi:hypothetical protein
VSYEQDLIKHYSEVRSRLQGQPPAPPRKAIPLSILSVKDYPRYVPFNRQNLTFCFILDYVAKEFNISAKDIRARRRVREITLPRSIAVWIGCQIKLRSLTEMGRYLGMDHTTMLHSRNRIRFLMAEDDTFEQRVLCLKVRLLADFDKSTIPAISKPHLGRPKKRKKRRNKRPDAVCEVPSMDCGSRSLIRDAETKPLPPDVVWELPLPTGASEAGQSEAGRGQLLEGPDGFCDQSWTYQG